MAAFMWSLWPSFASLTVSLINELRQVPNMHHRSCTWSWWHECCLFFSAKCPFLPNLIRLKLSKSRPSSANYGGCTGILLTSLLDFVTLHRHPPPPVSLPSTFISEYWRERGAVQELLRLFYQVSYAGTVYRGSEAARSWPRRSAR